MTHAPAFAIACHTWYGVHGVSMCLIPSTDSASMTALTPADSEPAVPGPRVEMNKRLMPEFDEIEKAHPRIVLDVSSDREPPLQRSSNAGLARCTWAPERACCPSGPGADGAQRRAQAATERRLARRLRLDFKRLICGGKVFKCRRCSVPSVSGVPASHSAAIAAIRQWMI